MDGESKLAKLNTRTGPTAVTCATKHSKQPQQKTICAVTRNITSFVLENWPRKGVDQRAASFR